MNAKLIFAIILILCFFLNSCMSRMVHDLAKRQDKIIEIKNQQTNKDSTIIVNFVSRKGNKLKKSQNYLKINIKDIQFSELKYDHYSYFMKKEDDSLNFYKIAVSPDDSTLYVELSAKSFQKGYISPGSNEFEINPEKIDNNNFSINFNKSISDWSPVDFKNEAIPGTTKINKIIFVMPYRNFNLIKLLYLVSIPVDIVITPVAVVVFIVASTSMSVKYRQKHKDKKTKKSEQ